MERVARLVGTARYAALRRARRRPKDFATQAPASFDEVLTVTALADFDGLPGGTGTPTCRSDVDDTPADFSSFAVSESDAAHTIAAPGVCNYSTSPSGGYGNFSGTSSSAPHAAGMVALCIAKDGCAASAAGIIQRVRSDAALHSTLIPGYGFAGDARSPSIDGRYYGYLAWAGGY